MSVRRKWWCTTAVVLLALFLVPVSASAQQQLRHSFSLGTWSASFTGTAAPAGSATWTTSFLMLEYRGSSLRSPYGFHLNYASGSNPAGGSDTFWSADAVYHPSGPAWLTHVFAGYGSVSFSGLFSPGGSQSVTSSGFRLGLEVGMPLAAGTRGGAWSVSGRLVWSPSNSVTSTPGGATSGAATEWNITFSFKPRLAARPLLSQEEMHLASTEMSRLTLNGDPSWSFDGGYMSRQISGSSYSWSGPFFMVRKTF